MISFMNCCRGVQTLTNIKTKILGALAVVIALVAMLIAAGIPAAASIEVATGNAVVGAAAFLEVFLIVWMVNQISSNTG
jgi:hypothetical protein